MKNWKKFFGMLGALICALGLNAMEFKSNPNVIAELEYFYAKDGTITGRRVNDSIQMYSYDKRGQLLAVIDGDGKPVEQYVYDPAGNILSKTVNGKTTTFTYDKANQLVNSTVDGKTTDYRYDGAGRLVQEGDKTYQYGYLDKILNVLENGETVAGFDYHMNGQIASSTTKDGTENFLWDGLALIHRGGTNYINEPAVTGGNPILADGNVLFNDMLGTTLGVKSGKSFNQIAMTAFGDTENKEAMFTGKPIVGEIGYVFLLRTYRADKGKWQTSDPLGYPDGWNSLAYVNNQVANHIDWLGGCTLEEDYILIPDPLNLGQFIKQGTGTFVWFRCSPGVDTIVHREYGDWVDAGGGLAASECGSGATATVTAMEASINLAISISYGPVSLTPEYNGTSTYSGGSLPAHSCSEASKKHIQRGHLYAKAQWQIIGILYERVFACGEKDYHATAQIAWRVTQDHISSCVVE